jgi:DNA (cytosine-5)-methyltransferase 1
VAGLTRGVAKGYFKEILHALKGCGYRVAARVLDAQWLGVPQERKRVIFVGVREDLDREPAFPAPLPYRYSIREALPQLGEGAVRWIDGYEEAQRRTGHPPGPDYDSRPSPTIRVGCTGTLRVTNRTGIQARKFNIHEVKTLCSFPPDFRLSGSYDQQWARLGNSVPPLMMKAVAEVVRDQILTPKEA